MISHYYRNLKQKHWPRSCEKKCCRCLESALLSFSLYFRDDLESAEEGLCACCVLLLFIVI